MDHISEQLMYDLVDGELSAEEAERVATHISSCKECRKTLVEILAIEDGIRSLWEHNLSKACPHEDTLFAYFEGRLQGQDLESVEKHLEDCPLCRLTLQIATESLERSESLERARKEFAPSLIKRLKGQLDKVEMKNFLDDLARILIPSRLGEELFDFLSKSTRVLAYAFASPLEAPALMPVEAGGVKLADTGKGFQRKLMVEPGTPFEVELVQFGDRFIMNFRALDEGQADAIVKYVLVEAGQVRRQGVLLASGGKGTIEFAEDEIERIRPEKSPLNLKLEVLQKGDVLLKADPEDILDLLGRLEELLLSEDPKIPDLVLEALNKIEELIT